MTAASQRRVRLLYGSISVALSLAVSACSSTGGGLGPSTTAAAVSGAADVHCGMAPNLAAQTVGVCMTNEPPASTSSCGVTFQPASPPDGGVVSNYGATLYNSSGYDDDCKYALSWTATPVAVNKDVMFTLTANYLTATGAGGPVHCAGVVIEVFNEATNTPAISPATPAMEKGSSGSYDVGPVQLTQSGMWTVRFHLYEECSDAPADSPHGHGAFFVNVP
jgi:hypothetical protein